jgi:hypothetical protein
MRAGSRPLRVLAWWDVDVHIGDFHKRKVTARPLKELERALGHRLHVQSWMRYDRMPVGVWKFEAYNYLQTADPAVAAYGMFKQLSTLSPWLSTFPGFNAKASLPTDDTDDVDVDTICAIYWQDIGLPRYLTGGVKLSLDDPNAKTFDRHLRYRRLARPTVMPAPVPEQRCDYLVDFTVHIVCDKNQDVISHHWPKFQAAHWPGGVESVAIDNRTHAGKPNIIRVRQTLRDVREHEAITHCLAYAAKMRVRLDADGDFRFIGDAGAGGYDGIIALSMTRTADVVVSTGL